MSDPTFFDERLAKTEEERDAALAALRELVACKRLKEGVLEGTVWQKSVDARTEAEKDAAHNQYNLCHDEWSRRHIAAWSTAIALVEAQHKERA